MERRQIEYFLAVIDHGGFTAAAADLRVSQPSLSYTIKQLEHDLGSTLFYRLARGVRLTAAGEVLADSARRIVRELDTACTRVREVEGLIAGRLDVISLPGLMQGPLVGAIGRFRQRYSAVQVRVGHAERPEELRDAVRSGAAELGLSKPVLDRPS